MTDNRSQVAAKRSSKPAEYRASVGSQEGLPPGCTRLRLRLSTIDDVKRELARLYRDTKAKRIDTQDASRMANMLSILGRLIEGAEFESRLEAIERAQHDHHIREGGRAWPTTRY